MIRAVDRDVHISLVANGVDTATFQLATIPEDDSLRLICVARLIERKGQHHLIQAVQQLIAEGVAVTLELVGTGDAQNGLQAQAVAAGIAEYVHFSGYVPREEIAARYAAAHVFVLPSYNEGMSVATLEALAAGLPVVVTRTGGTVELVTEEANGLTFDWADVTALTAHLRRLAADRALVRRMGEESRIRAGYFSWEAAAAQYVEMFRRLTVHAGAALPKAMV